MSARSSGQSSVTVVDDESFISLVVHPNSKEDAILAFVEIPRLAFALTGYRLH